jgi:hypothetical protein
LIHDYTNFGYNSKVIKKVKSRDAKEKINPVNIYWQS